MAAQLRMRFWVEAVLAGVSGFLFVLTLAWRDWIEAVFRVDPDHHSGSLEWAIVAALLAITLLATMLARAERRRPQRAATAMR
jgi:hypothetical protein